MQTFGNFIDSGRNFFNQAKQWVLRPGQMLWQVGDRARTEGWNRFRSIRIRSDSSSQETGTQMRQGNQHTATMNGTQAGATWQNLGDPAAQAANGGPGQARELRDHDLISSKQGNQYKIKGEKIVGKPQGEGALYRAVIQAERSVNAERSVLLQYFDCSTADRQSAVSEIEMALQDLVSQVHLSKAHQFRLLMLWEAFRDARENDLYRDRFYLITCPVENSVSLASYLKELPNQSTPDERQKLIKGVLDRTYAGPSSPACMAPPYVRQVLENILQSLGYLHTESIRLVDFARRDQRDLKGFKGQAHGNLTPDHVLIVPDLNQGEETNPQFSIYLQRLYIWETLFQKSQNPGHTNQQLFNQVSRCFEDAKKQEDLKNLGKICLALLCGWDVSEQFNAQFNSGHSNVSSLLDSYPGWKSCSDVALKEMIQNLLERLSTVEDARKTWEDLKKQRYLDPSSEIATSEASQESQVSSASQAAEHHLSGGLLLILLAFVSVGVVTWWMRHLSYSQSLVPLTAMSRVPVSQRTMKFGYAEVWEDAITRRVFLHQDSFQNLTKEIEQRTDRLQLGKPILISSQSELLQQVRKGDLDFALSYRLPGQGNPQSDLRAETIAYDGLAILRAFSDTKFNDTSRLRKPSRTNISMFSKITLEDVVRLYTEVRPDLNLPRDLDLGQVYLPTDNEQLTQLFEELVLKDSRPIQQFNQLKENGAIEAIRIFKEPLTKVKSKLKSEAEPSPILFEALLKDYEQDQKVSIGFARLSTILGQCSVYPLAVGPRNREVQPLVQVNGLDIDASVDRCAKGSHWPNSQVFKTGEYPLSYELTVVYAKDNSGSAKAAREFIELMKTDEGQCLLREAGLVPLDSARTNRRICSGSAQN